MEQSLQAHKTLHYPAKILMKMLKCFQIVLKTPEDPLSHEESKIEQSSLEIASDGPHEITFNWPQRVFKLNEYLGRIIPVR